MKVNVTGQARLDVDVDVAKVIAGHREWYWRFTRTSTWGGDEEPQLWERPAQFIEWILRDSYEAGLVTTWGVHESIYSGIVDELAYRWSKEDFAELVKTLPWVAVTPSQDDLDHQPGPSDVPLLSLVADTDTTSTQTSSEEPK